MKLIYSHCLLAYQVKTMTLASTVFKKSTFQKISNLNALGSNFDLEVKWVKVNLGSSYEQFGRPKIQNVNIKSQGHQPSGSGEEDF